MERKPSAQPAASPSSAPEGCGLIVATWLVGEIAAWLLLSLLGTRSSVALLGATLGVGIVVFMVFATMRVLRGHDL